MACEKVPMISQFGTLTISPTVCDDAKKGIMLSFVSPNNAIQMMVPTEALPMDPSTLLEAFEIIINCGFSCEDVMEASSPKNFMRIMREQHDCLNHQDDQGGEDLWDILTKMIECEIKGVLNKNALRHAKDVCVLFYLQTYFGFI